MSKKKNKKMFVLDTNVILHDFRSIYNFEENDIIIPIVVLEELDKFKKGNDLINFHAREFMRDLDKLAGDKLFNEGISLGEDRGLLFIETIKEFSDKLNAAFSEKIADHKILSVAEFLKDKNPDRKVILVTQDINLRMKAKALGIEAQDYESGKVADVESIYKEIVTFDNFSDELINKIHQSDGISIDECSFNQKPIANDYFILKGQNNSVLSRYDDKAKIIQKVVKTKGYGIKPKNAEQSFAMDALMRPEISLVTITGKAGTGKTLLALAAALEQRNEFQQIYLARPIVALANKDLGFLPGDAKEKIGPYMLPLFDNLAVIKQAVGVNSKDTAKIDELLKEEKLLITPLAYIRGRSLSNVYFIVDEAQNLTPHEIKTIITRAGEGTKMVFTGDIEQIDSPYLDSKSNGLSYLTDRMKGQSVFAHVNLVRGERSHLADLASNLL
jgi:PhoH-like ATPase